MTHLKLIELENRIANLEKRIEHASMLLWDYDGYYDPIQKTGDVIALAGLIDESFKISS